MYKLFSLTKKIFKIFNLDFLIFLICTKIFLSQLVLEIKCVNTYSQLYYSKYCLFVHLLITIQLHTIYNAIFTPIRVRVFSDVQRLIHIFPFFSLSTWSCTNIKVLEIFIMFINVRCMYILSCTYLSMTFFSNVFIPRDWKCFSF